MRAACPRRPLERLLAVVAVAVAASGLVAASAWTVQAQTAQVSTLVPSAPVEVAVPQDGSGLPPARDRASRGARDRAPLLARGSEDLPVDPLPHCSTELAAVHANGQLPIEVLCDLPDHVDHRLRADAARALVRLATAYAIELGEPLCMTDSYRSLEAQHALAVRKPGLAARPGTSEHGWGLAADLACGAESYDTPQHRWLVANAGRFGWGQPAWAQDGGAREEPWHWEYLAGQQGRATSP